ncbi:MAG: pyridoxal-phosphate dependent enzyme [Pseudomonadota bacterium]
MPVKIENPWCGRGLLPDVIAPIDHARDVQSLLSACPKHAQTPLIDANALANDLGLAKLWIKDERSRMGLGSFKALGAAHAIAHEASKMDQDDWATSLVGVTFVTASAGNHGLSVAAGARVFGAAAVVYLAHTVPEAFAKRLASYGACVMRAGETYETSMDAAALAARENGWTLLSDSSWQGYFDLPLRVMEGYVQMAAEAAAQVREPPTHILLQAGVGGLAAAVAAHARATWGAAPTILVIEPEAAPALMASIQAGETTTAQGPVSCMGRLDCKTPSLIALRGLSRDADGFVTLTEKEAKDGIAQLAAHGLRTTPSGGATLAALLAGLDLGKDARVLTFLSEGPEDA